MRKPAKTLMIQGTTSDAGKSFVAAAICRWLANQGVRVAPFKPQNMALNSAVTLNGGEIGRAQAFQAEACRIAPTTDMNPILLKPNTDIGAQVIVHGKAIGNMEAKTYHRYKPTAMQAVLESYHRLESQYDIIIVEGAGSPAEINLREGDIANMGFAEAVDCPVILVADIDRGGVFAHIVGTLELLSEQERARVKGIIINRFRGDVTLLQPGIEWLEQRIKIPVLGVSPYLQGLHIDAEDAISHRNDDRSQHAQALRVIVPITPRLSNHTDFDPLRAHPQVDFQFVRAGEDIPPADLIILGGSKSVRHDLAFLRQHGWEGAIQKHLRYGGKLIGICGGFQMLGKHIHDPLGLEGEAGNATGFGWLEMETTLAPEKQLRQVSGALCLPDNPIVSGYEIHAGKSTGIALERPAITLKNGRDGAISEDNQILATYLHGLFDTETACKNLLDWASAEKNHIIHTDTAIRREDEINQIANEIGKMNFLDNLLDLREISREKIE